MATVTTAACATAAAAVLALASSSSCYTGAANSATVAAEMSSSSPATSQECAVCLSELAAAAGGAGSSADADPPAVRTLPVCGHGFHAECIGRWLPLRRECPLCRRPVPIEDLAAASAATAAPAWARPARIACGFGDGRIVWTRSPSVRQ